jgi:hypothetical protein
MDKISKNLSYTVCGLTLLITACQSSPMTTPVLTNTIEAIQPTLSSTPELASTPTIIITPTPQTSSSSLPTLEPKKARAFLTSLLQNNGDCQFPCVWGVTREENNFNDVKDILAPFGIIKKPDDFSVHSSWDENSGLISFSFKEKGTEVVGLFTYPESTEAEVLELSAQGPTFESTNSSSPLLTNFGYYLLPQVLSNYGPPSEIIVGVFPAEPSWPEWRPMNVGLFYPTQGFYIEYIMTKEIKHQFFVGCPAQVVEFSLVTWDPTKPLTLMDIATIEPTYWGMGKNILDYYYRPLEQALSINITEFYEKYKDPKNEDCIMSPMSSWPHK